MNYQRIILAGNATRDAEQKQSKKGDVSFTTFSVAVNEGKEKKTFFPIVIFGKHGEAVARYITKGKPVLIEGRLSVTDKGTFNVIGDQVRLGAKPSPPQPKTKPNKKA